MAPAMERDYAMLRRLPDQDIISTIHSGNLGNTLTIGSGKKISRETFLKLSMFIKILAFYLTPLPKVLTLRYLTLQQNNCKTLINIIIP